MNVKEKFSSIFLVDGRLAVKNQIAGWRPFGEQLVTVGKTEYRLWDPNRSKLAAAIMKGLTTVPIREGDKILYLGVGDGRALVDVDHEKTTLHVLYVGHRKKIYKKR